MKRLSLFPITTTIENGELALAGIPISSLAEQYGTPLYLYDRATLEEAVTGYQTSLRSCYPGTASLTYAGKAFLCKAVAQWTQLHQLFLDCSSEGEIAIAQAGGVPRDRLVVHGVNKSRQDLLSALRHANIIVADHPDELEEIARLKHERPGNLSIWLRMLPGVAVQTHHAHTQTGHHDSKFGMTLAECREAAGICRRLNLNLNGIHFHLGSNFQDTHSLRKAIEPAIALSRELGLKDEWHFSPGGGWGVAYHEDELPSREVHEHVEAVASEIIGSCMRHALPLPHLHLEPGRSLIARAGVAVYRVGAVKQREGRTWILVDGGMTDNPRHALYGARYTCLPVIQPERENVRSVSIGGPHCESGDVLIEDLPMPRLEVGDLLAVPVSGAYQLSMSSNYNGALHPAVLWLEAGKASVIQRRETVEELLRRDEGLPQVTPGMGDHQVKPPTPGAV